MRSVETLVLDAKVREDKELESLISDLVGIINNPSVL